MGERLVYFHLVAGTCPTNILHAGTSIIWGDTSRGLVLGIQTMFEFVGQVAGTKLNFLMEWIVHTKGLLVPPSVPIFSTTWDLSITSPPPPPPHAVVFRELVLPHKRLRGSLWFYVRKKTKQKLLPLSNMTHHIWYHKYVDAVFPQISAHALTIALPRKSAHPLDHNVKYLDQV